MNLRTEVHNAIITKFCSERLVSTESAEMSTFKNKPDRRSIFLDTWDPWCDYVRLYPKQLTVARLLLRFGKWPMRVEAKNLSILIHDDACTHRDTWSVLAVDRKSSLVLACVIGTQRSPFSEFLSEGTTIYEEPRFLFNHLDYANSRVSQIIEFILDFQLKKPGFGRH